MGKKAGRDNRFLVREAVAEDLPVMVDFLAKLALHVSGAPPQSLKESERDRLLQVLRKSLPDPDKLLVVADVPDVGLVGMGYLYVWRNQGIWEQAGEVEFTSGIIDDV
ncbi:MAG: GNAT family N-acetyltransferase, partial [Pseudohongiella sp.]